MSKSWLCYLNVIITRCKLLVSLTNHPTHVVKLHVQALVKQGPFKIMNLACIQILIFLCLSLKGDYLYYYPNNQDFESAVIANSLVPVTLRCITAESSPDLLYCDSDYNWVKMATLLACTLFLFH